jgi:sirohydrochlorin cobaltochelatase
MAAVAKAGRLPAHVAYLDLAPPDLETAARTVAGDGARRAVVVPLLFTAAFHATIDVPETVRAAAESSGVDLLVADILGTGDDIADLLRASLADAGVGSDTSVLLYAVGSSNAAANAAVVDLADRLQVGRLSPVRATFATCSPRPVEVLDQLGEPVAVLPLFLSDGLLLDPVRTLAGERGWPLVEPLGERAADVVLHRYRTALASVTDD